MSRFLVVAVVAGLLGSCSGPDESGCAPTSDEYSRALRLGLLAPQMEATRFVTARSSVPGTWYVASSIDGASPVWATDRDPSGNVVGDVLAANRAAQRLSKDVFNMPFSHSPLAAAAGNPDGIRHAENCVSPM